MARKTAAVAANDDADVDQYNHLRDEAEASSRLLATEQAVPDLTLLVLEGNFYLSDELITFAGGNSPSFTAPSANPRIDILSLNQAGTLVRTAGVEDASPVAPALPAWHTPICHVFNRTAQTKILEIDDSTHGYISKDVRPIFVDTTKGHVVSNTTENSKSPAISTTDDVVEVTIPADTIGTSNIVEFWIPLTAFGGSNALNVLKIKLGSTQLTIYSLSVAAGTTGMIHGFIMGDGTTSSQRVIVDTNLFSQNSDTGDGSADTGHSTSTAAMTEDATTALTLTLQITRGGGNGINVSNRGIIVLRIK